MGRSRVAEYLGRPERPAFLAPLAGFTDLPFRVLCHRNGSTLGTTELASATGIRHAGLEPSWRYLAIKPEREGPVLIQLFGAEPDDFFYAAEQILAHPELRLCSGIDINIGCPVPKVVRNGAGAALMNDSQKTEQIVRGLTSILRPTYFLGCKIRRGYSEETAPEYAQMLVEAGCDILTIHGRYRDQFYSGEADWGVIKRTARTLAKTGLREDVYLVANGDVTDKDTMDRCLAETGADAVAVGRAAQGNPWIFRELAGLPPASNQAETILQHAEELCEFLGEATAMKEFRKTLAAYATGRPNARQLRGQVAEIHRLEDVARWIRAYEDGELPV